MSFYKVLLEMEEKEELEIRAILAGLGIREDFWDDFLRVINNREAVGELLGIRPDKIATWNGKIKKALIKTEKSGKIDEKIKTKMINTGRGE